MKHVIAILFLAMFILAGCSNPRANDRGSDIAHITFETISNPTVGAQELTFNLKDLSGNPINDAIVSVTGDMSHAGMKAIYAEALPMGEGTYVTQGFKFTMGGDWFVTVSVQLSDSLTTEEVFEISGVSGESHSDHDHSEDHSDQEGGFEVPAGDLVPSVALVAQRDGDAWEFTIETNMKFSKGSEHASGEGHAHVYVNNKLWNMVYVETFRLNEELKDGENEVLVLLSANNHLAYTVDGEIISDSVTVHSENKGNHADMGPQDDHNSHNSH